MGSDTIACVLATGLHKTKLPTLLIDLGTNGEIVFGSRDGMVCCSTAAGPAFEGGHIGWGMRASAGAIEHVTIDADTLQVSWKVIGQEKPTGLCGSGVISAVAGMIRGGIVLTRGNFDESIESDRLREGENGLEFVIARASETAVNQDIVITQKDVAELQMAKSAIHAGITLLMEKRKGQTADKILMAGAGGNYIDHEDACTLDLFPGCVNGKIEGVGNAAGHGAYLALVDRNYRKTAEDIAREMEYLELAAEPHFQELFVSGMFFTAAHDFEGDF